MIHWITAINGHRSQPGNIFAGIWAIAVLAVLLLVVNVAIPSLQIKRQAVVKNDLPYYLTNSAGQVYPSKVSRTYWDLDDNSSITISAMPRFFGKGCSQVSCGDGMETQSAINLTGYSEGDGIIALTDGEVRDIGLIESAQSFRDASNSIYLVAGFHQLHCLVWMFQFPQSHMKYRANLTMHRASWDPLSSWSSLLHYRPSILPHNALRLTLCVSKFSAMPMVPWSTNDHRQIPWWLCYSHL